MKLRQNDDLPLRSDFIRNDVSDDVNGIIVMEQLDDDATRELCSNQTPLVVIGLKDRRFNARKRNISFVSNNNRSIGQMAARHLLECGKFNSYVCLQSMKPEHHYWSSERYMAFAESLVQHGIRVKTPGNGVDLPIWLDGLTRPVAIFAVSDSIAEEAITSCSDAKLDIASNFAFVSVDNDELICQHLRPRLTSIQPGYRSMGQAAAKELSRLMRSKSPLPVKIMTVKPVDIIVRDSTHRQPPAATLVDRMETFIRENACLGISAADVIHHARTSRRLAETRFRQLKGVSIRTAIEQRRLESARRLLATGKNTVAMIARQCGFSSANRLTRVFKLRYGQSIRNWQKLRRKA